MHNEIMIHHFDCCKLIKNKIVSQSVHDMMDKQNNNNISTHFAIPNNANPQEPVSAERPLRDYVKSPCKNTQLKVPQWHPRIQRLIIMSNIASITDQATHTSVPSYR